MIDLYQRSIEVIRRNQAATGAYVASPAFAPYAYCWLRDGSFTAYAMDRAGQAGSARAFFRWVHATLQSHAAKVERCLTLPAGDLTDTDYLHTRYTVDGEDAPGQWWNFQLDGYGSWLWALAEHVALVGDKALVAEVEPSIALTVRYLAGLWQRPNFDYWEEHGDRVHIATLAALYGGLAAAHRLRPRLVDPALPESIRQFVLARGVSDGHLVKYLGTSAVDASLLAAGVPYRLLAADDPLMAATAACIERDLAHDHGVHRYLLDTYYGGGQWILLSAWLGWYHAVCGETAQAAAYRDWVEAQATPAGDLPEQVATHLLFPERRAEWQQRWGKVATPLLWSHAMYLILATELKDRKEQP